MSSRPRPPGIEVSPGVWRCVEWPSTRSAAPASARGVDPAAGLAALSDSDDRDPAGHAAIVRVCDGSEADSHAADVLDAGATQVVVPGADSRSVADAGVDSSDEASFVRDATHGALLDAVRDGLVADAQAWAVRIRQVRALARLSFSAQAAGVEQFPQLEMAGSWQVSQLTATRWDLEAEHFELSLPQTLQALEDGVLLVHQAQVLLHRTRHCTEAVAQAVEHELLPVAADLCPSDLRKRVDRVVLRVESELADAAALEDPEAVSPAEQRHAEAVADRHVFVRSELDGMAIAGAALTAEQAVAWSAGLDLLERRERLADRVAGLDRSAEQRRADLFAALPAMVLAGTAEDRAAAGGGAAPGVAAGSLACPCGRTGETGCCRAAVPGPSPVTPPPPGGASGPTGCDGLRPWTLGPEQIAAQVVVNVHVPMATVLELSREPGTLDRYGPVSAEHVRLLRPHAFRKVLVDSLSGKPLSVDDRTVRAAPEASARREQLMSMLAPTAVTNADEAQHDPSQPLARLVDLRDAHCCGPGCSSTRTDRDHHEPWPAGPTAERNLGRLSRRCHRAKHHGWTLLRHQDGGTTWTSPLARSYDRPGPHRPPPRVDLWADPPPSRPRPQVPPPRWTVGRPDQEGGATPPPTGAKPAPEPEEPPF